jgi:hypothetical protein
MSRFSVSGSKPNRSLFSNGIKIAQENEYGWKSTLKDIGLKVGSYVKFVSVPSSAQNYMGIFMIFHIQSRENGSQIYTLINIETRKSITVDETAVLEPLSDEFVEVAQSLVDLKLQNPIRDGMSVYSDESEDMEDTGMESDSDKEDIDEYMRAIGMK